MPRYSTIQLKEALESQFDANELRELVMHLDKTYDEFSGDNVTIKALEIATWSQRLGRMDELGDLILQKRPQAFGGNASPSGNAGAAVASPPNSGGTTIHIHGPVIGGVVGGGSVTAQNIAGRDINVQEPTSQNEFRAQVAQLQQFVQEAIAAGEINPEQTQKEVQSDVQEIAAGVAAAQPNDRRLSRRLEDVKETLESAAETAVSGGKVITAVAKAAALAATLLKAVKALF